MVDELGHLAFGLLFALPAWHLWRRRVCVGFLGLVLVASLFPDVDRYLEVVFPAQVHHHGVTHTVVFVVLASVVGAAILTALSRRTREGGLGWTRFTDERTFGFSFLAFLVGGVSHLFADTLSAPDISTPIEPFWPFFDAPWSLDVIYYDDPLWNGGFLLVMLLAHLLVAFATGAVDRRFWKNGT